MKAHQWSVWHGLVAVTGGISLLVAAELALRARYRRRVLPGAAPAPGRVTVVTLGDSITAGAPGPAERAWPGLLAEHLLAHESNITWRVVNAGVPGDTAPGGYNRFDHDVAAAGPQAVLIAFGLNDCNLAWRDMDRWLEGKIPHGLARSYLWRAVQVRVERWKRRLGWTGSPDAEPKRALLPRTSPEGFANALAALVTRVRDVGARPVLLTMTPLSQTDMEGVRARSATYDLYNVLIRACANRWHVPLVELASGAPVDGFEPDGFHLTSAGQAWVARQVYAQLAHAGLWARLARSGIK